MYQQEKQCPRGRVTSLTRPRVALSGRGREGGGGGGRSPLQRTEDVKGERGPEDQLAKFKTARSPQLKQTTQVRTGILLSPTILDACAEGVRWGGEGILLVVLEVWRGQPAGAMALRKTGILRGTCYIL